MDYITSIEIPPWLISYTVYAVTWVPVFLVIYYLRFVAMWVYELVMA